VKAVHSVGEGLEKVPALPGLAVTTPRKMALAGTLAFLAGYADVVCFIRYHCFASMMTGNVLVFGKSFIQEPLTKDGKPYLHHAAFVLGLIVCRIFGLFLRTKAERAHRYGTALLTPFLVALVVVGELANYIATDSLYSSKLNAWGLAIVFGVQADASMKGVLGCPTMMVTGHIQNLTHAVMAKLHDNKPLRTAKVGLHVSVISGLCFGSFVGAAVNKHIHGDVAHMQFTPVIIVLAILLVVEDQLRQPDPVVVSADVAPKSVKDV